MKSVRGSSWSMDQMIFLVTSFAALLPLGTARAEEGMETRFYPVPPTFFKVWTGDGPIDPFAAPDAVEFEVRSPREILERAGVTFEDGAYAWACLSETHGTTLVVHNTAAQHELVEAYGCFLGPGDPKQLTIIVESIEVDAAWLSRWMLDHRLDRDGTPLRKAVQGLVRKKKAKVADTSIVMARSGQRARSESVRKIPYPNSEDPSEVSSAEKPEGNAKAPTTSVAPTLFTEHTTGVVLEADPVIGPDNATIDLLLAPLRSVRDGETSWPMEDSPAAFLHEKPKILTQRISTQLVLTDGSYALLGTVDPLESGLTGVTKTKVLRFVRVDIGSPTQGETAANFETVPRLR